MWCKYYDETCTDADADALQLASQVIIFDDPVVEALTREILGKHEGDISAEDVLDITVFGVSGIWNLDLPDDSPRRITTLQDFIWFTNLQSSLPL